MKNIELLILNKQKLMIGWTDKEKKKKCETNKNIMYANGK